jgi:malonyl-CoA O-methyltransferase
MSIQEGYDRWADSYDVDQNLTRDLDQSTMRGALKGLHCALILEIGCGTGKNTRFLSQIGDHVCAMDFSPGMLEKAAAKIHLPNVHFIRDDITRPWPFQTGRFNLVVCNLVLEHIQDLSFIFAEVSRVMAARGMFYVSELHPFRQYLGKKAVYSTEAGRIEIPAHIHHISEFIKGAEASALRMSGFDEEWHPEDVGKPPRLAIFKFVK